MGIVRAITDLVAVVALLVVVEAAAAAAAVVVVVVVVCHVVLEEDWAKMKLNEPVRKGDSCKALF